MNDNRISFTFNQPKPKTYRFSEIQPGKIFVYGAEILFKMHDKDNNTHTNVIGLRKNEYYRGWLAPYDEVIPVELENVTLRKI